jgi:hypothetical protein
MNFGGFLKRTDKLDKAFEDLQSGMMDALQEDLEKLPFETDGPETIAASAQGEGSSTRGEGGEEERIYLDPPERRGPTPDDRQHAHGGHHIASSGAGIPRRNPS